MNSISELTRSLHDDIRAVGLGVTGAQVATLGCLRRANAPSTHSDVAESLRPLGFDRATVFRNLKDMTEAGLLRRTDLGGRLYRFEEIGPSESRTDSASNFLCTVCGSVRCMDDVELTAESLRQSGLVGEIFEILLRGRCHQCT